MNDAKQTASTNFHRQDLSTCNVYNTAFHRTKRAEQAKIENIVETFQQFTYFVVGFSHHRMVTEKLLQTCL